MKTKTLRQSVNFNALPHEVYEIMMDSKKHSQFTGDKARISRKEGGKFKVYGDYIEGTNISLIKDKKIVQSWRANDWPQGHYSKVIFVLKPDKGGTNLRFTHSGIPGDQFKDIKKGWIDFYWNPLKIIFK